MPADLERPRSRALVVELVQRCLRDAEEPRGLLVGPEPVGQVVADSAVDPCLGRHRQTVASAGTDDRRRRGRALLCRRHAEDGPGRGCPQSCPGSCPRAAPAVPREFSVGPRLPGLPWPRERQRRHADARLGGHDARRARARLRSHAYRRRERTRGRHLAVGRGARCVPRRLAVEPRVIAPLTRGGAIALLAPATATATGARALASPRARRRRPPAERLRPAPGSRAGRQPGGPHACRRCGG